MQSTIPAKSLPYRTERSRQDFGLPYRIHGAMANRPVLLGSHHLVSSTHYQASQAGLAAFEMGGTAIDAGVAAGLAMDVVAPTYCDLAGVAPIMLFKPGMTVPVTLDGLGWAGRSMTRKAYIARHGAVIKQGIASTVVPAALDAWLTALERYGTLPLAAVAEPAIELADGFPIYPNLIDQMEKRRHALEMWPTSKAEFLPAGRLPRIGEMQRRPDLATLLRRLVEAEKSNAAKGREGAIRSARDYFYKGEIAHVIARFVQEEGGFLEYEDLAGYSVSEERALRVNYRGYDVYSCGPWCQGPVIPMVLNMLSSVNLRELGHNSIDYTHVFVEAMKLAFADREAYGGDWRVVDVPIDGMISDSYGRQQYERIDWAKASPGIPEPGNPWVFEGREGRVGFASGFGDGEGDYGTDTTYLCAMDADGNAFSATPSDNSFAAPLVPGLGVMASTRGQQFWLDEGHPCSLEPGKRPRLTPNPAMVLKDGRAELAFGSPGGDNQTQVMLQFLCNVLDFGMDVQQAIEAPRFRTWSFPSSFSPHAYEPGVLTLEAGFATGVQAALAERGHEVSELGRWVPPESAVCGIRRLEGPILAGGADPSQDSYAVGR